MIKICYIIGQLSKHGAEGQLYELVKNIDKNKFNPIVVSLSQGGYWSKEIKKLDVKVIEIRRNKNKEFSRLFKLIKILRDIQPDIVHTYLFPANSYGRIAAILNRTPVIIASERSFPVIGKDKNAFRVCIDKFLSFFSHAIICNSNKAAEILVNKYFYNNKKVFFVHNGKDMNDFKREVDTNIQTKSTHKVIATVGRMVSVKNHYLFIDMAKTVLDITLNNNIKFLIVGDGPLRGELEEYAKKLGIEQYIDFTGERTDVIQLLQGVDIFVMTSLHEGLSNAIIEAMMSELPVVATNVGGNSELVKDMETGFLCESNNASALSKKVVFLINNKNKAKRMGENAKNRIINEFGIEKMVKKTDNIYITLLKQNKLLKQDSTIVNNN